MKNETKEEWKPVRNYEGVLEVSNYGNIKLLERFVDSRSGGRKVKERILPVKVRNDKNHKYAQVNFGLNYKVITLTVGRVVYESFNNIDLDHKKSVVHKDGNALNNRLENIKIITRRNVPCSRKSKSGYTGVCSDSRNKNNYIATTMFEGKNIVLHRSKDKEECRKIYELAKAMIDEYDKLKAGILSNSRLNNKLIVKSLPCTNLE